MKVIATMTSITNKIDDNFSLDRLIKIDYYDQLFDRDSQIGERYDGYFLSSHITVF